MTGLYDWDRALDDGDLFFDWAELVSAHEEHELRLRVMRDAVLDPNGLRQPATAAQMQRVADRLGCMLMTPKVVDLVWAQAALRLDAVVSVKGRIVANCSVADYNTALEKVIAAAAKRASGYPDAGCVACVGKYWVVCNSLARTGLRYGQQTAANYGWFSSRAPRARKSVTGCGNVWQRIGTKHNDAHVDPSQVVRLLQRSATLVGPGGGECEVDLHEIAADPQLSHLINHDGVLHVLRQPSVPAPAEDPGGAVTLPETTVYGKPPKGEDDGSGKKT
jgi:hypothetical protein